MAFQVSKTRHNSRTKHYFANPRIKIQVNILQKLLLALDSSLSSCSSLHRHTNKLPYTSLAHVHRGITSKYTRSLQQLDRKGSNFLLIWFIRKGFSPAKYSSNTVVPECTFYILGGVPVVGSNTQWHIVKGYNGFASKQPSYNLRTKHCFANPRIKIQENSLQKLLLALH